MEWILLPLASLFAGFVDAIVGGGGLILLPALFAAFPGAHPATLFGVNKGAAVWGTTIAASQYIRRVKLHGSTVVISMAAAFAGSMAGAWVVTQVDSSQFRKALPFLLTGVLLYTLWKKDLGRHHIAHLGRRQEALLSTAIGVIIGFYDGVFGPGTGSFFVFALVRLLGYDFLHASALAKLMNVATNLSALAIFIQAGHIWWEWVAVLAAANVLGSVLGTRLALKHGAGFIRKIFLVVVSLLILKTGYDAYFLGA